MCPLYRHAHFPRLLHTPPRSEMVRPWVPDALTKSLIVLLFRCQHGTRPGIRAISHRLSMAQSERIAHAFDITIGDLPLKSKPKSSDHLMSDADFADVRDRRPDMLLADRRSLLPLLPQMKMHFLVLTTRLNPNQVQGPRSCWKLCKVRAVVIPSRSKVSVTLR